MKHLKIAVLALLLVVSYSNVKAQDKENPWMTTVGANYMNIKNGDSGNIMPYVSLGRYIDKGFSLELAGTVNKVLRPWGPASDATFLALDLNVKYDLNNVFGDTKWFDPFLYTGIGQNSLGAKSGLGYKLGVGFNAWFNDHVGMTLRSEYKKVNTPVDFEMYQHTVGLVWRFGKSDTDGDGIRDRDDACPRVAGLAEFNGCPDTDADDDGISDCCDACPNIAGLAEFDGCPDSDGDGVPDKDDACPEIPGLITLQGCPDKDEDGVTDAEDLCPDVFGPIENSGCPYIDNDGDGVIDIKDKCITVPGPASNDGCPVDPSSEVMAELNRYGKTILFDTGKATFSGEDFNTLESMMTILKEYPETNFVVEGHTDSVGTERLNQLLSERRASAVRDYLISKGINPDRLKAVGYGESRPVDSNDTASGRANNRRTEVVLK